MSKENSKENRMTRLKFRLLGPILAGAVLAGCAGTPHTSEPDRVGSVRLVEYQDIEWGALNPARGDNSPRAGTLWGDRTSTGPSGFLVRFEDGFSSPPHIHNVTYRGVVIHGLVHNDDPDAERMWLPGGSFWTQPAGDVHITAAKGGFNLAYIEIDEGPYLVQPTEEAFDDEDVPVNVDASNLVWLDASSMRWIGPDGGEPQPGGAAIALLWGDPQDDNPGGSMVRLPAGFKGEIRTDAAQFRAVVIRGEMGLDPADASGVTSLPAGSCFASDGGATQRIVAANAGETILYVRTDAPYRVIAH